MKPPGLEPWNIGSSLTKVVHAALEAWAYQGGAKPDISSTRFISELSHLSVFVLVSSKTPTLVPMVSYCGSELFKGEPFL